MLIWSDYVYRLLQFGNITEILVSFGLHYVYV